MNSFSIRYDGNLYLCRYFIGEKDRDYADKIIVTTYIISRFHYLRFNLLFEEDFISSCTETQLKNDIENKIYSLLSNFTEDYWEELDENY